MSAAWVRVTTACASVKPSPTFKQMWSLWIDTLAGIHEMITQIASVVTQINYPPLENRILLPHM